MASTYFYSTCTVLAVGCVLFSDSARTTPVPAGYYTDGTNYYYVSGATPGRVDSVSLCSSCL